MTHRRGAVAVIALTGLAILAVGEASAANVATGLTEESGDVTVPTWLYLATGGGVVGAAALMTVLVTDRSVLSSYTGTDRRLLSRRSQWRLGAIGAIIGLALLAFVLVVGVLGPSLGTVSAAVLVTIVGVRAVLPMVAYLVGNPWPGVDPFRRIAAVVPTLERPYPERLASWPAVVGVLALVWIEIVAPVAESAPALVALALAYGVVTVTGAVVYTPAVWFRRADPLAVTFRLYGAVAPIQRGDDGLELRWPGGRLGDADVVDDRSLVAVVLVLVWELTYSGFIVTEPGAETVRTLVGLGIPPSVVYLGLLVGGLGLFWWVYWQAATLTRRRAETYLSAHYVGLRFAPPLLAIAAGYHLAHYGGFTVSLTPTVATTVTAPLSPPPNPTQFVLPGWFGYVEIAGILLGHVLAVWVAHVVSFELFPGKLQAIRSQAPFVAIMIAFTMVSLYLVSLPASEPPYTL